MHVLLENYSGMATSLAMLWTVRLTPFIFRNILGVWLGFIYHTHNTVN